MLHPDLQAAVALERRKTMRAEAEAARLARQARRTSQAWRPAGRMPLRARIAAWLSPARRRVTGSPAQPIS